MSYFKYVFYLCFLFIACENKTATIDQTPKGNEALANKEQEIIKEPDLIIEPKEIKIDTVTISTLEDLVDNAKSNSVLILEKGTYGLKENLVYLMTKDERTIIDKNVVETRSIGGQLHFSGLENFQIIGKKGAVIKSENPKAVAFFILGCSNFKASNLTIRNNAKGTVDLCYISNSQNVEVDKCKFDGGGAYGIYTNNVNIVTISNSLITKCTVGAVKFNDSKNVTYTNTTITNNIAKVPLVNFYGNKNTVTFNNVKIVNNKRDVKSAFEGSDRIFALGVNSLQLNHCVIRDNEGFTFLGVGQNSLNKTEINGVTLQ
jgi:hypothetical protein